MSTSHILLVDDEINNRNAILRLFEDYDIEFIEAGNGQEALDQLQSHPVDLILLDIKMPIMDGFGFLERFSDLRMKPKPPVCVMTAFNDSTTRRKSIYLGADDFINKPIDPVELETRIASLLRISHFQQDLNAFNQSLEERVNQRTQQLQQAHEKLKATEKANARAYREMIGRVARLTQFNQSINRIDPHRLGLCAAAIGWLCDLPEEQAENLSLSSQLHNIGMLALPEKLREAPAEGLTRDQLVILSSHTKMGSDLFKQSEIPLLKQTHNICLYCEEHYDGSGLPNKVKGDSIPIEARIFTAARLIMETLAQYPEDRVSRVRSALQDHSHHLVDPDIVDLLTRDPETLDNLIRELE
ncbi:response regulator [Ketobacter sp.]|uniref:response regulator n=1 Tax=Ketobacter sp. TaxID=2083498 RepID=UPI000F2230C5|nr:response regulator [Ketobacter sp.]RLT96924.1 MAG: response regulator [Ketobacter sp.]